MRKTTFLLIACLFFTGNFCTGQSKEQGSVIKTQVPVRPEGQTDVLQLTAAPMPVVRVAFIGLGMRGPGAVERMTHIDGVEIVELCDVEQKNT